MSRARFGRGGSPPAATPVLELRQLPVQVLVLVLVLVLMQVQVQVLTFRRPGRRRLPKPP
jgi:hypothetical protein